MPPTFPSVTPTRSSTLSLYARAPGAQLELGRGPQGGVALAAQGQLHHHPFADPRHTRAHSPIEQQAASDRAGEAGGSLRVRKSGHLERLRLAAEREALLLTEKLEGDRRAVLERGPRNHDLAGQQRKDDLVGDEEIVPAASDAARRRDAARAWPADSSTRRRSPAAGAWEGGAAGVEGREGTRRRSPHPPARPRAPNRPRRSDPRLPGRRREDEPGPADAGAAGSRSKRWRLDSRSRPPRPRGPPPYRGPAPRTPDPPASGRAGRRAA